MNHMCFLKEGQLFVFIMDYFGYTLWTELMLGNRDWITSLELGDPEEFDPEGDFWPQIFKGLSHVITAADLFPALGGCFHISSAIAHQTADQTMFNILPHFEAARQAFQSQIPFELGVHMTFNDQVNPLGPLFVKTFIEDITAAAKMGATVMVVHPTRNFSYPRQEIMDLIVQAVTAPEINAQLRKSQILIAWENMIEGQFSSLEQLLRFREAVADRLSERGDADLMGRHLLCLDTGHLLIWRHDHPSSYFADREIETSLPEFAKFIKAFHIHGNDGSEDFHITPRSTRFMDHPTRSRLHPQRFQECSERLETWLQICHRYARVPGRHIHLETDKVPFALDQTIVFGRAYKRLIGM